MLTSGKSDRCTRQEISQVCIRQDPIETLKKTSQDRQSGGVAACELVVAADNSLLNKVNSEDLPSSARIQGPVISGRGSHNPNAIIEYCPYVIAVTKRPMLNFNLQHHCWHLNLSIHYLQLHAFPEGTQAER